MLSLILTIVYNKIKTLKALFFLGLLVLPLALNAQNSDTQRYVGLQLLNLDPRPEAGMDVIEASIANGCNLVALTIQWDEVYKDNTSPPDWRQYDRQIEYIAKTNAKIALRIIVGRLYYRLDGYWTAKETMKDDLGRPLSGVYGRTCFSFSHQPTVAKSQNFIKEVCQRYNAYQNQGKILYVSFGNLSTQELGYPHETNFEGGKQYLAGFDYSDSSLDSFRVWAEKRYKRINKLNYHWGTKYTSFKTLMPPGTAYNPYPTYRKKSGKDWYLFSHSQLQHYIDGTINGIKQVNPQYKIVNEYGAVTADFSAMMISYSFKTLDAKTDGTKVHNDPYYNHRWVTDVIRSNRPANKWTANEVFYTPQTPIDLLRRQFNECFEHGSKIVTLVTAGPEPGAMRLIQEMAGRWLNTPLSEIKPQLSISYTLTEALDSTMKNVEKRWVEKVGSNPQPVHIELVEDILSEEYWKPLSLNLPPIIANQVTERASKPRKAYSYTLPKDVFADPDGDIVKIEALEKPQWLNLNNGILSGNVPDVIGDYKITLRATDDEGATVLMSFNLKVTNINVKPIVKRPVPDFETSLQKLVFYQFLPDHFDDPDGVIVRIQASGLRPWMTYSSKEFSAYPQEQGTFTVNLRAYDDDSAFVETSFKIKVLNIPPVAKQQLPEKVIARGKAFRFKISPNLFSDPDGEIVRVGAAKLPAWLTFNGTELRGTPPELATYRVGIRAYDNGGDSVEIPFVIKVDVQGAQNSPPLARYTLPNVQMFATQKFTYRVPDSLFYDTNGYVDRIEAPNLPAWLSFQNNEISGVALQAGTYTVTVRAIDDDETATNVTFKIEVRYANISFELIQAGKIGERRLIGPLTNGDVLQEETMPNKITIYANCEVPAKRVLLKLTGPYQREITAERFPFALFDETTGFSPIAGSYTLEAAAFNDSLQVSAATIRFTIKTTQPLTDWQVYPNPFSNVCNVKLPDLLDINSLSFRVIAVSGQEIMMAKRQITVVDKVAYINLSDAQLPSGTYILQVFDNETLLKGIRILKL